MWRLFFHQCFQCSLSCTSPGITSRRSVNIGDFRFIIIQNDPRSIPKHSLLFFFPELERKLAIYSFLWLGLDESTSQTSVLMSIGSILALQYSCKFVMGFSICAKPNWLIGVLVEYWLMDEGGRPERTDSRPNMAMEYSFGWVEVGRRSVCTRCKAWATPLDLRSSWSLEKRMTIEQEGKKRKVYVARTFNFCVNSSTLAVV